LLSFTTTLPPTPLQRGALNESPVDVSGFRIAQPTKGALIKFLSRHAGISFSELQGVN